VFIYRHTYNLQCMQINYVTFQSFKSLWVHTYTHTYVYTDKQIRTQKTTYVQTQINRKTSSSHIYGNTNVHAVDGGILKIIRFGWVYVSYVNYTCGLEEQWKIKLAEGSLALSSSMTSKTVLLLQVPSNTIQNSSHGAHVYVNYAFSVISLCLKFHCMYVCELHVFYFHGFISWFSWWINNLTIKYFDSQYIAQYWLGLSIHAIMYTLTIQRKIIYFSQNSVAIICQWNHLLSYNQCEKTLMLQ
jgi:hypothetical protein